MKISKSSHITTILFSLVALGSCQLSNSEDEQTKGEPIARVYDRYLYQSEIESIIPTDLSSDDSISLVQNYIDSWARNQLMLKMAEFNLTENQKSFEEQIKEYRNDLLKFAYQQEYVRQKLDTNILEEEIAKYYQENSDNFQLKENILMANFLIIDKEAPDIRKVKKWFRSTKEKDQEKLMDYAITYADRFSIRDTNWISYHTLVSLIPVETYNQRDFLSKNKFVEISGEDKIYLLEIVSYKIKDSTSPLPYVKSVIKNILVNQKKLELLTNLEKKLFEDALKKKEFETY